MPIELPDEFPAMTLTDTVLLPSTVLPLYIFEKRYRRMLADALAGQRMFAILNAPRRASNEGETDEAAFRSVATVGIIRMSSLNSDGTSTVMLQGAERIRVLSISQETPYRIVRAERLPDQGPKLSPKDDEAKKRQMLALVEAIVQPSNAAAHEYLVACHGIELSETLAGFAMQTLCNDSASRQAFLETTNAIERIDFAIRRLREIDAEIRLQRELQNEASNEGDTEN